MADSLGTMRGTPMMDESAIRETVTRLARPTASGGSTIERAALLAEGADCSAIEAWILSNGGEAQTNAPNRRGGGLHADRLAARVASTAAPTRYVLPAGSLG
jgi:hypothetical protein